MAQSPDSATYIVAGTEYSSEAKAIKALAEQHGPGANNIEWLNVAGTADTGRVFVAKNEVVLWLKYLRNHGRSAYDITQPKEGAVSEPKTYFDKDGNERQISSPGIAKMMLDSGELFRENPKAQKQQDAKQNDTQGVQPDGTQNPPVQTPAPAKAPNKTDGTKEVNPDGTFVVPGATPAKDEPVKPNATPDVSPDRRQEAPRVDVRKPDAEKPNEKPRGVGSAL